jgi:hypothetical protein
MPEGNPLFRTADGLLDVRCEPMPDGAGWTCRVRVGGPGAPTTHDVAVSAADLARLAPGAVSPEGLVGRSFAFLLVREPKESILRRFDLIEIGRYFPEYERTIRA